MGGINDMKKKVVITVLCVMSCFMLASCGKKGNEGKDPLTGEEQNQAEESSSTEESQTGDNRDFDTVLSEASQPMEIMDYLNTNLPNASNEDTNRYLGGLLSFGNDVRDIDLKIFEDENRKIEIIDIGISCKNNHEAVKHPRITENPDFAKAWTNGQFECSRQFICEMNKVFDLIDLYANKYKKWSEVADKKESIYYPIIKLYAII